MEDGEIVDLYLARDEAAVAETRSRYGRRLRALSLGIVGDAGTAEECEDDTYMRAWISIPPNEPRSCLYAYLARIARRLSLNCCRDRERLKRSAHIVSLSGELEECIPDPGDGACRADDLALADAINGFLKTLSREKRRMFLRRYWYADSVTDIARRLGVTESKVAVTLFRCREKLREHLIKEGIEL